MEKDKLIAYVDGSYDKIKDRYSFGCVFLENGKIVNHYAESGNDKDLKAMWNVGGEILGAMRSIQYAIISGYKSIDIYYDYQGIQAWADRTWRAKKPATQTYARFIDESKRKIDINFIKVKAHSNVLYNEIVDNLAKRELNLPYNASILKLNL